MTDNINIPRSVVEQALEDKLREVSSCFTREDDLPNDLLPRIDAALNMEN